MTEPTHRHEAVPDFDPTASSLAGHVAPEVMAELLSMRSSIDNIDATLVYLLAERFKATQRVGFLKAQHRLPPGDPGREAAQIARLRALAESAHLDPAFAEKFLNFIISEVIRHHQAISESHSEALRTGATPVVNANGTHFAAGTAADDGGSAAR
ncbi:chorismate mutase [Paenarthrobacter sp. PH39-S1]|uniref:chorismate mutase n=1 Tax=Paenarthrobacter sp. PH39-S1 TaxID=3046204 RepID=UPI0024B9CE1F|nr:chorismate mutase [Paenarthrobacter sp. PH39-S1]MDJ0356460.1 chorismate mutase [Paenarthrobacter sp. PH39-S1]